MRQESLLLAVVIAWENELGQSPSATTTWEESGGDSVRLVSFLLELERIIGRSVSLELLSSEMTPISLARNLAKEGALESEATDRGDQSGLLVFLMPWLGGDGQDLVRFRAELKGKIRFVVIEHPKCDEMVEMGGSFDAIVNAACAKILESEACDLYFLAGESSGGFVAWEAARRLLALGRRVGFVGLVDTCHPNIVDDFRPRLGRIQRIQNLAALIRNLILKPRSTLLTVAVDPFVEYSPLRLINAIRRAVELISPRTATILNQKLSLALKYKALRELVVRPLQVPTVLFRSVGRPLESPDYGWKTLCPQLTTIPVEGEHELTHDRRSREILSQKFLEAVTNAASMETTSGAAVEENRDRAAA